MKGRKKPASTILKVANANRGKKRTDEQNQANRERAIKYFSNPENREKASAAAKRQWEDPRKRKNGEIANREIASREDTRDKKSNIMKKLWSDKNYRENMSKKHIGREPWNKGVPWTEEYRKNVIAAINKPEVLEVKRKKSTALWKNDEYIKKIQASFHCKPNKPETAILNLLNDLYPNEWKYTGDFSFVINGKSPDFVNCNGKKLIIEMFGDYWHKGESAKDREDVFKPFGYETLVIWESELKNIDAVKSRIQSFNGGKNGRD